jgi:transposase
MRTYGLNFKQEAIKLANEIGTTKTAKELNIPISTLDGWFYKAKTGRLTGRAATPQAALTMAEELKRIKQENMGLRRINEILSKATAFFAQSQKK